MINSLQKAVSLNAESADFLIAVAYRNTFHRTTTVKRSCTSDISAKGLPRLVLPLKTMLLKSHHLLGNIL